LRLFHVDAFTPHPFTGNPAAVVLTPPDFADAALMQSVAAEMNLSETAFVSPVDEGSFALRWFTPTVEVDLCGHATLATAHVIWTEGICEAAGLRFSTRSGALSCWREDDLVRMDFPANPPQPVTSLADLGSALGTAVDAAAHTDDGWLLAELPEAATVRSLDPDPLAIDDVGGSLIVTARGDREGVDIVSRVFAPGKGIPEDPVTGAAHCVLAPWWSGRLGERLTCEQASARGGRVLTEVRGDRVVLGGYAVTVARGELDLAG
jgi:PhzF family phenazine biosynthesis protein